MPDDDNEIYARPEEKQKSEPINQVKQIHAADQNLIQEQERLQGMRPLQLEPVELEQTRSRSKSFSFPGPELEAKEQEEQISQIRSVFDEKIKEQDARFQRKLEIQKQLQEIREDYQDEGEEELKLEDIPFMTKEDREILANAKKELGELEQQEVRWEEEIQTFVEEKAEYKRDYLLAKLEWEKSERNLSKEEIEEQQKVIGVVYEEQKKRDDAEVEQRRAGQIARRAALRDQLKHACEWLSNHQEAADAVQISTPVHAEFLYYYTALTEAFLNLEGSRQIDPQEEDYKKARELVEQFHAPVVGLIRGTLQQELAHSFPLLERVDLFQKAIRSDDMEERAAAWYQLRSYEARLEKQENGNTRLELFRGYLEECMQQLQQDPENAKAFLLAAWGQSEKAVSNYKDNKDILLNTLDQSIPKEEREKIATMAVSLTLEMRNLDSDQLLDRSDLTNLEGMFEDRSFLTETKEQVKTQETELMGDARESFMQLGWMDQAMPELIQEKQIVREKSLQDLSTEQKQNYQKDLRNYQKDRGTLLKQTEQKKLKVLNGYLAEFDRYTGEEDVLYQAVRGRLLNRIIIEAERILNPEEEKEKPGKDLEKAILNCIEHATAYTNSVRVYGQTLEKIRNIMEGADQEGLFLPGNQEMLQDARIRAMIEAVQKEKTIFSSSDFKRIAVRLNEYQTALQTKGREGAEAQNARTAILDAVNSYLITKLVGKLKDPVTGKPIEEVARISDMVLSGNFSLKNQTAKSTGLTQEGFARLKLAFRIRQITQLTGADSGDAGGVIMWGEQQRNRQRQEIEQEYTPLMKERYGLYRGLYGLEQLSRNMESFTGIFAASELKQTAEAMKRYLEFGKMAGADSFEAYQTAGFSSGGHLEQSEEYANLTKALDAYEKKYPIQKEDEMTPVQSLVRQIRIALRDTNQSLNDYFREVLGLLIGSVGADVQADAQKANEQGAGASGEQA